MYVAKCLAAAVRLLAWTLLRVLYVANADWRDPSSLEAAAPTSKTVCSNELIAFSPAVGALMCAAGSARGSRTPTAASEAGSVLASTLTSFRGFITSRMTRRTLSPRIRYAALTASSFSCTASVMCWNLMSSAPLPKPTQMESAETKLYRPSQSMQCTHVKRAAGRSDAISFKPTSTRLRKVRPLRVGLDRGRAPTTISRRTARSHRVVHVVNDIPSDAWSANERTHATVAAAVTDSNTMWSSLPSRDTLCRQDEHLARCTSILQNPRVQATAPTLLEEPDRSCLLPRAVQKEQEDGAGTTRVPPETVLAHTSAFNRTAATQSRRGMGSCETADTSRLRTVLCAVAR